MSLLIIGFHLLVPYIFKLLMNVFSCDAKDFHFAITFLLFFYGFIWLFSKIMNEIRDLLLIRSLERIIHLMNLELFFHLNKLKIKFPIQNKIGEIISAIERAQIGFERVFWSVLTYCIPTIIELIFTLNIILYAYRLIYSVIIFTMLVCSILFTLITRGILISTEINSNNKQGQVSGYFVSYILQFESKKHIDISPNGYYDLLLQQREDISVKSWMTYYILHIIQWIIMGVGFLAIIYLSGNQVMKNELSIGDFVLIKTYLVQFIIPLNHLGYYLRRIQKGLANLHNIHRLLHKT